MPRHDFKDLAHLAGEDGRWDNQWGYYELFKCFMAGKTVLDVGTGISKIKDRTAGWDCHVTTHEACPDCPADVHGDLGQLASKSFQTVTCFDVIEHVKQYGRLVYDMARIASETLIITTPGYGITGCTNPYHWHEFLPDELAQLIEATGMQFHSAFGSEWISYPERPGPFRAFKHQELYDNFPFHPIALAYQWANPV